MPRKPYTDRIARGAKRLKKQILGEGPRAPQETGSLPQVLAYARTFRKGCKYAVVIHTDPRVRTLMKCHKTLGAARKSAAYFDELHRPTTRFSRTWKRKIRVTIFDIKTGKKVLKKRR